MAHLYSAAKRLEIKYVLRLSEQQSLILVARHGVGRTRT